MTKELQDHVWSILPKEFREEVKYEYSRVATKAIKSSYDLGFMHAHEGMYGHHNLTSDAEGEDEMLHVSRKRVQDEFNSVKIITSEKICSKVLAGAADMYLKTLERLFGSKCLPDNVESSEPNVESSEPNVDSLPQNPTESCNKANHISTDDSKPAEPTDFGKEVNFPTKKQSRNFSQETANCDNRLQIAAMAMQGILSNENAIQYAINNFRLQDGSRNRYQAVAECSLAFADALIAESEKRTGHGK